MSDPFGSPPPPAGENPGSWKESVAEFVDARLELIRHEAREASRAAVQRGVLLGITIAGVTLAYLLLLAGLIGWMTAIQDRFEWWAITLFIAALHLLVAVIAVMALRRPSPPSFPLTRTELSKDREWLQRLKKNPPKP